MSANPAVLVTMTAIWGGQSLSFAVLGDPTYSPASGGQGGWQIIDRPRLVAALQWYDRSPMSIVAKVLIDSEIVNGVPGQSIEAQCRLLDSWQDKIPGTNQPQIFSVSGPVAGTQRQWALYTFTFNEAIRDLQGRYRTQQNVDLTLYEYNSPLQTTTNNPSPAAQAVFLANQQANGAGGYYAYTVKAGDTLETIAAALLNNYSAWGSIATLNNLRDPNNLFPGQVLSIPNS
jgi:hypothetical protein